MRQIKLWALALASTLLSTSAISQDLFSSTNSTVHSYSYVEVQYLLDVDAKPPLLASLLLDVSDHWSLKAEYLNQDFGNVAAQFGLDPNRVQLLASAQALGIGGLYHQPLAQIDQTDWIAGFMLGRIEIVGEAPAINRSTREAQGFQEFYAGLRRTFSSRLEGEAALNLLHTDGEVDLTVDVKFVFRVINSIDLALAGNELGGADIIGIGLRYTW